MPARPPLDLKRTCERVRWTWPHELIDFPLCAGACWFSDAVNTMAAARSIGAVSKKAQGTKSRSVMCRKDPFGTLSLVRTRARVREKGLENLDQLAGAPPCGEMEARVWL
jgi:hypothetical protein